MFRLHPLKGYIFWKSGQDLFYKYINHKIFDMCLMDCIAVQDVANKNVYLQGWIDFRIDDYTLKQKILVF